MPRSRFYLVFFELPGFFICYLSLILENSFSLPLQIFLLPCSLSLLLYIPMLHMLCYIFGKLLTILDFNIYLFLFLFSVVISVWEDCIHISSNFLTCSLVVSSLLMNSLKAFFIYITVFLISRISVWFLRVSISMLLLSISSCILSTFFNETLNT